jgi:RNA polymerase sigma-70 factor (ECF subfamily)
MDFENSVKMKSDEEIADLVETDKEFFGELIRRYEKRISGYARKMNGGTRESVEDIVQNIFIKAYVYINSFEKDQKFSSWLYGIAHNECIDFWRKNKKHSACISLDANENLSSILASAENLPKQAEQNNDQEILRRALEGLPLKYREVLVLRFLDDKSYEDIAQILKKPVSTVGTLVRRAKILFEEIINKK